MFSNENKQTFAVLGFSILIVFSANAFADLLRGPSSDIEAGGAIAECGTDYPGSSAPPPSVDEGTQAASCGAFDGKLKASADLPNGEVKVYASSPANAPLPYSEGAYSVFVDLITVTDGWDENGEANGTFELEAHGTLDVGEFTETSAAFSAYIWRPSEPTPPCLDVGNCSYTGYYPTYYYDYAAVFFRLIQFDLNTPSELDSEIHSSGTGYGLIQMDTGPDVRATLTVPWRVTEAEPSFYVAVSARAYVLKLSENLAVIGTADFFNTAKGNLRGPENFQYTSRNGFGTNLVSLPPAVENPVPSSGPVGLNGKVESEEGIPVCAMVLASGQYMFSCDPQSQYALNDLPREADSKVTRQVYADGFFPVIKSLSNSTTETVVMTRSGNCPNYNFPSSPDVNPAAAGELKSISGRVLVGDTEFPICAMVLANGSYMFSCDGSGNYALEFPLDASGQFQLQVYANGFAPAVQTFDESDTGGDVRMASTTECQ